MNNMEKKFETPNFGNVTVRTAVFDVDGKNLEEGIEIKGEDIGLIELYGWRDIDELSIEELEELIELNL